MFHAGGEFRLRGRVGTKLVGHHHPRQAPSLEELAHEPFGGRGVAPRLNEDVQHVAVRRANDPPDHSLIRLTVDRPPEPMSDAVDLEDDLVEVPLVGRAGSMAPDLCGDLRPELRDPDPDRLMGDDDPARSGPAAAQRATMRRWHYAGAGEECGGSEEPLCLPRTFPPSVHAGQPGTGAALLARSARSCQNLSGRSAFVSSSRPGAAFPGSVIWFGAVPQKRTFPGGGSGFGRDLREPRGFWPTCNAAAWSV